jgi:hypothetical protein
MPQTLTIGIFVLGAVMLLLALVSGGFKVFGSEMPGVVNRSARVLAFLIGALLVGFSLIHFREPPVAKASTDQGAQVPAPQKPAGPTDVANRPPSGDQPAPNPQ